MRWRQRSSVGTTQPASRPAPPARVAHRVLWSLLLALALVGVLAAPAAAWQLQRFNVTGQLVVEPVGEGTCRLTSSMDESTYYASYTDSRYRVGDQAHFFLLLTATDTPLPYWVLDGQMSSYRRGLQVKPYCVTTSPCACAGAVGSALMTIVEPWPTHVRTSFLFTALTDYDDYASRVLALGGTPVSPTAGYTRFGYAMVDLTAAGGSHTAFDVRTPAGPIPDCGNSCPSEWRWVSSPYETRKEYEGGANVIREEWCHDGIDGNGDGRIDETCWGDGGHGPSPGLSGGEPPGPGPLPPSPSPCGNQEPVGSSCNLASGNLTDTIPLLAFQGGPLPLTFSVAYNSLDAEAGRLGRGWVHSYGMRIRNDFSLTLQLVDATGGWTQYRRVGASRYYPQNRPVRDTIDKLTDGRYVRRWPNGALWIFDAGGWLTEMRDANGNAVRLTYAADGATLTQVTDPSGRTLSFTYDTSARVTQVADSAGRSVAFVYSTGTTNRLVTIVEAGGGPWDFTYDSTGRMLTKTNPRRDIVRYGYTSGRLTSVTDAANVTRQISYDLPARTTRVIEPGGATRVQKWDGRINAPAEITDPSGRKTTYSYFGTGHVASVTDGAGHRWRYWYDSLGRRTSVTDPLTRVTLYTYDGDSDRIATRTDPDGAVTTYTYDAAGNLLTLTDATSRTTTFGYDARGNLTAITDPAGQATTFTYDAQNLLTSSTDPTGVTLTYTYDAVGRLATVTDEAGAATSYAYDALNRMTQVVDPLTHATGFAYDAMGNQTSRTDALSRVTQFAYDARGLLSTVTDPASDVTTYSYDDRHRLTSLTDAESRATTYTYDDAGRVLTETGPLGDVTTYAYDTRGLLQFITTPRTHVLERRYDAAGRLIERLGPGGLAETYTYDVNGRLATATGGGVTYTFAYDLAGRVTSVIDSRGYVVSYTYDAAGRRQTLTYPGGQVLTYGYDLAGRLTSLTDGPRVLTIGYDSRGRRASLTYPNGTQTTYSYDLASRLTGITHATSGSVTLHSFTYGLDAADSRTSLTTLAQGLDFGYDLTNRLTGVTATPASPLPAEAFTYDGVGNRLTGPDPGDAYTYNAGHQLLTGPGTSYTYDASGNRATKTDAAGTTTYTWDASDRLAQAVVATGSGTTTVTFTYDALGRRIAKTVVTTPTSGPIVTTTNAYVYDGEDILWEEVTTDAGGAPVTTTTRYVHGPRVDEPLLIETGGQVLAVHADGLGSVTGLTDASQTLVEARTYTAFGQMQWTGSWPGLAYAYTGREWEPELGLYYHRARYYDPGAGRFLSRDPIGFAGGDSNVYAYVLNDPVNHSDPTGLYRYADDKVGRVTNPRMDGFLRCLDRCTGKEQVITSTTDSSHMDPGHALGTSVDIRPTGTPSRQLLCCAGKCGAAFALDERKVKTKYQTGPHYHVQLRPPSNSSRNAIPPECRPGDC